ncbi:hypothetical protein EV193_11059 [Herbihabitans rhizosphaerae]|uniref:Uncharacterized protein n=1 Tax=Herbihabitans rhizosphaerae TaxID=1872711 RepID=A0A4Q7KFS1_9PSEU|nr:hypothetical protein EV193_11059 [Herbihabitans rhizosphaerae]
MRQRILARAEPVRRRPVVHQEPQHGVATTRVRTGTQHAVTAVVHRDQPGEAAQRRAHLPGADQRGGRVAQVLHQQHVRRSTITDRHRPAPVGLPERARVDVGRGRAELRVQQVFAQHRPLIEPDVARPVGVVAQHGQLSGGVVLVVGIAATGRRGFGWQRLALVQLVPAVGDARERGVLVQPVEDARPEPRAVHVADRSVIQSGGQRVELGRHLRRGAAEPVGVVPARHPLGEVGETIVEPDGEPLVRKDIEPGAARHAVQHHPVGALREQGRVRRAEVAAVGGAVEGDALLAEGGADPVDVPRGVLGRDVRQQIRGPRVRTLIGDGARGVGLPCHVRRRAGVRADHHPALVFAEVAGHRRAHADPARVEADQVVALEHLARAGELFELQRHRQRRATRAAGVEQQHAAPPRRVVGHPPRDFHVDGHTIRMVVVQRHSQGGAPQLLHRQTVDAHTIVPPQRFRAGARVRHHDSGHRHRHGDHGEQSNLRPFDHGDDSAAVTASTSNPGPIRPWYDDERA